MRNSKVIAISVALVSLVVVAGDQPESIKTELTALANRIPGLVTRAATLESKDYLQSREQLKKIGQDIFAASKMVRDSKSKRAKSIKEYAQVWLRLQTQIYSVGLMRLHLKTSGVPAKSDLVRNYRVAQADNTRVAPNQKQLMIAKSIESDQNKKLLAEADSVGALTIRLNKDSSVELTADLPFNSRHVDTQTVELFLLEQDKQGTEYAAIASTELTDKYEKMLQFSAVRTMFVNRWALDRMGYGKAQNIGLSSCAPDLVSFRMNGARRISEHPAFLELGMADRFEDWAQPEVQSGAVKATLAKPLGSSAEYEAILVGALKGTPAYSNFFFDFNMAQQQKFLKDSGDLIAATEESNWTAQAEETVFRSLLPGDSMNRVKIADRVSDDAYEAHIQYIVDQAVGIAQQMGSPERARLEKAFRTALPNAKYTAALQDAVSNSLVSLDAPGGDAKRRARRASKKLGGIFAIIEPNIRYARDMALVKKQAMNEYRRGETAPASLKLGSKVTNPLELKDQFMAMLDLPENEGLKKAFTHNQISNLMLDFIKNVSIEFEKTKKPIEQIAGRVAVAMQKKYPAQYIDYTKLEPKKEAPRFGSNVAVSDNTRVVMRKPVLPTPGVALGQMLALLNLKGTVLPVSPVMIRSYLQHYVFNAAKIGKIVSLAPVLQTSWVAPQDEEASRREVVTMSTSYGPVTSQPVKPKPIQLMEHIGRFAFDEKTMKHDRNKAYNFLHQAFQRTAAEDKEKVETFCQADIHDQTGDENFRKMFRSSTMIRAALQAAFPEFVEQDADLMEATKTTAEVWVDSLMMAFLVIGGVALIVGLTVFTMGAASLTAGPILMGLMAVSGKVLLPLTIANLYFSTTVAFIEKPAALAFQESVLKSQMLNQVELPKSAVSQIFTSEDPISMALQVGVTSREDVTAARTALVSEQRWTAVFAALDLLYLGEVARTATGLKAAMSWRSLRGVLSKPVRATQIPVEATINLAQSSKTTVKGTLQAAWTRTRSLAKGIYSGEALAWFRPAVQVGEAELALVRTAGKTLGNDLTKSIAETEEFLAQMGSRLDKNERLLGKLKVTEIMAHPEMTWFGNVSRLMTGRLGKVKFPNYNWYGLSSITELEAMRQNKIVQWASSWGRIEDDIRRLRGALIKKDLIEPGMELLAKMKEAQEASVTMFRQSLLAEGATSEEVLKAATYETRGEMLMLSLNPAERKVLMRMAEGESMMKRMLGIYRFERLMDLRAVGALAPVFKDYKVVKQIAINGLNPEVSRSAYEEGYVDLLDGNPGAAINDVPENSIYKGVGSGSFDPLKDEVVKEDLRRQVQSMLANDSAGDLDAVSRADLENILKELQ